MSADANGAASSAGVAHRARKRAWIYTQHLNHVRGSAGGDMDAPPEVEQEGEEVLTLPNELPDGARYQVAQLEVCPSTGRTHVQGFIYFNSMKSMAQVVRAVGGAHVEPCRNIARAIEYCMKEDSRKPGTEPVELGVRPKQGTRSDLAKFSVAVLDGTRKRKLVEEFPSVIARYPRFYDDIKALSEPERPPTTVYLLVGPTCTGKSTLARKMAADAKQELWVKPKSKTSWFDGYDGQPYVLFDDFKGHVPLLLLLELLDKWSVRVEVKGSFTWFNPSTIIITSNYHPDEWYDYSTRGESRLALYRRIHHVYEFTATGVYTDHDTTYVPGCDPTSIPYFRY